MVSRTEGSLLDITDKDLPDTDGKPVDNLRQPLQASLLTASLKPTLRRLHKDTPYLVGMNAGIYWRLTKPPLDGCKAPDWFYVPGVSQTHAPNDHRGSYVYWQENKPPYLVMEFVSGSGAEEHDQTENTGKFWVYEQAIHAQFYAIFDKADEGTLEVYELVRGQYRLMTPNQHGHYELPALEVALGVMEGTYVNDEGVWLRFFDLRGRVLTHDEELLDNFEEQQRDQRRLKKTVQQERRRADDEKARADDEKARADAEHAQAQAERQRAEALAAELAALKQQLQNKATPPDVGPGASS